MKAHRLVLAAVAGASALTLSACAPTGDVAIEVGKTSFTNSDVDLLTTFECAITSDPAAGGQPLSRQSARAFMATVLVSSALDQAIAKRAGIDPSEAEVSATMEQLEPYITKAAKGEDRDRLRDLVQDSILGQVGVSTVVQQTLGAQLQQVGQEQAAQIVQQGVQALRLDEAKKADLEIDPVFGLADNGLEPSGNDPSLSKAVSDFAKSAAEAQPDQTWLDALPARQKCS